MAKSPIFFLDYDKISDTLIYFSQDIVFRFNVQLGKKDRDGRRKFFHREFEYQSKYTNVGNVRSIKRDMTFYYSIDDNRNYQDGIIIGINDVYLLKISIEKSVLPWYINKPIYGTSPDDGRLIIKGKWTPLQFAISDYKYLTFKPIILTYEDGKTDFGTRIILNREDNFVDIEFNKFLAFYNIIASTDMYAVASSMVNYVKTAPYDINKFIPYGESQQNYFDKL